MKASVFITSLIFFTSLSHADVYQCTNGEFRDTPCPNNSGNKVDIYNPMTSSTDSDSNASSLSYEKFSKAIAKVEIVHSLSYDCKNELSRKKSNQNCEQFTTETAPYGELEQAIDTIKTYAKNKEFYERNSAEIETAFNRYKNIYNAKTYMNELSKK